MAVMKAVRAARVIPRMQCSEAVFKIGDMVLMYWEKNTTGPKQLKKDWSRLFTIKEEERPRYIFEPDNKRKSRKPVQTRRLRRRVAREYGYRQGKDPKIISSIV